MDFIVVCPHCDKYVPVDATTYVDKELYLFSDGFHVNGTFFCYKCRKESIFNVKLEPTEYSFEKV